MAKSRLRDGTEPAVFVPTLLSNMTLCWRDNTSRNLESAILLVVTADQTRAGSGDVIVESCVYSRRERILQLGHGLLNKIIIQTDVLIDNCNSQLCQPPINAITRSQVCIHDLKMDTNPIQIVCAGGDRLVGERNRYEKRSLGTQPELSGHADFSFSFEDFGVLRVPYTNNFNPLLRTLAFYRTGYADYCKDIEWTRSTARGKRRKSNYCSILSIVCVHRNCEHKNQLKSSPILNFPYY